MSKPRKQEVDYFPHYCDHGKVLFIMENNYQNDGYAVFYKLYELLAKTNGHCYDASTEEGWQYLLSKMLVPEHLVLAIIEKLASMGTIDYDLWKDRKIWIQTFIDSVEDAYARRNVNLPAKPVKCIHEDPVSGINVDILPAEPVKCIHLSVKESKVKKSKVNIADKNPRAVFQQPSLQEVVDYCKERKNNVDPEKWINHYLSNGWKVGKNTMKDWKAAVRNWEKENAQIVGSNGRPWLRQPGEELSPAARKALDDIKELEQQRAGKKQAAPDHSG